MDYSILEVFTTEIIYPPASNNQSTANDTSESGGDLTFGMNDGLLDIIRRISSLHYRSRTGGVNNSTTITEAVAIWQDLDNWQPPKTLPEEQYQDLYDSYTSALFTWLYLILHPDSMCDDKVQAMVERGVASMAAITILELSPFLLVPLFIHGLASVQEKHRDFISNLFDQMEDTICEDAEVYRTIVERSWDNQDRGMCRSWEWIQCGDTGAVG